MNNWIILQRIINVRCCLIVFIILFSACGTDEKATAGKWTTTSPNGSLSITLSQKDSTLHYFVMLENDTLVNSSSLGIRFETEDFVNSLQFINYSKDSSNNNYTMITGKRKNNQDHFNGTTVRFKNKTNTPIEIHLRAYDDGVAFRYNFPEINKQVTVVDEVTSFAIPANGKAWLQPYALPAQWAPSYEEMYDDGIPIGQSSRDSSGYSFAALFETNNHWLLLTEAGLDEHFYGSHLQQHCQNGIYKIAAPQAGEANGLHSTHAINNTAFATPWRTIIAGKSPGTIIESNLVLHLAAPSKVNDPSWIKPGRSSWSWWSDHPSSKNYNSLKKYVDLSSTMGWEYSLVDANWNIMQRGNIEQLIQYAKSKNIGLALWYNSAGPHSTITEQPRDIMNDPAKRKEEFKKLVQWGIKTVKVDFFNSDKQEIIKLYLDILKDAAEAGIMVDTHGCTLQRGWARTWPNLMTMEGVHGAEQYGWDTVFARKGPQQNIVYAFTRNVVGSMDYTPVTFSSYPCCQHATSDAYEAALPVLFESGITHFADKAESFLELDSNVRSYLRTVPAAWDDTKFIQGYPGKDLIVARSNGDDWYIAGVNGEGASKNIDLDLSFLRNDQYQLTIISDGKTNRDIQSLNSSYTRGSKQPITMRPYGGFVIRAQKIK